MAVLTFRIDDLCPQMDMAKFNAVRRIFERYGVKPCIGVVPDNKDPELMRQAPFEGVWDMVRELRDKGWAVAQHGCNHVYATSERGMFSSVRASEFAGLPYEEQKEKISRGMEILHSHGLESDIFMAPSHTLDNATLDALGCLGFRYVTDGISNYPYIYRGLYFLPCKYHYPVYPLGVDTCCIHTNTVTCEEIEILENFLSASGDIAKDFSETLKTPPERLWAAKLQEKAEMLLSFNLMPVLRPVYLNTINKIGQRKVCAGGS